MAKPDIDKSWFESPEHKLSAYTFSQEVINLINKSETLKADIRAYAQSASTKDAELEESSGKGSYVVPGTESRGFLRISSDFFQTPSERLMFLYMN